MRSFFQRWAVNIRQSSAHYPQSNGRAEAAVKTAKMIMRDNTGPGGSLAMERVTSALLQYHNTPLREGDKSPAQLLLGRQLRDGVPVSATHLMVQQHWKDDLDQRERMMAEKAERLQKSKKTTWPLPKLAVGQHVRIQDSVTKRWNRTGVITRILRPIRQYTVRLDGSGRLVLRNRRFLRPTSVTNDISQNQCWTAAFGHGLEYMDGKLQRFSDPLSCPFTTPRFDQSQSPIQGQNRQQV